MDPFLGQIIMFAGNFAPRGWAFCDGQLLPISQYSALFSILGTIYGGDGRTTFALPDLRGRVPMHPGNGPGLSSRRLGEKGGAETNILNVTQIPSHNHSASATASGAATGVLRASSGSGDSTTPSGNVLAETAEDNYSSAAPDVDMHANAVVINMSGLNVNVTVANTGGNQPINNMQPYLCVNFIIALQGVFPSRS